MYRVTVYYDDEKINSLEFQNPNEALAAARHSTILQRKVGNLTMKVEVAEILNGQERILFSRS